MVFLIWVQDYDSFHFSCCTKFLLILVYLIPDSGFITEKTGKCPNIALLNYTFTVQFAAG